ncbi:MAG: hypothetical protein R2875_18645, partial [Desulfobacterales bacterium]
LSQVCRLSFFHRQIRIQSTLSCTKRTVIVDNKFSSNFPPIKKCNKGSLFFFDHFPIPLGDEDREPIQNPGKDPLSGFQVFKN